MSMETSIPTAIRVQFGEYLTQYMRTEKALHTFLQTAPPQVFTNLVRQVDQMLMTKRPEGISAAEIRRDAEGLVRNVVSMLQA